MPFWEEISQDPMKMMLLVQAGQGLANSMSYGGTGGGQGQPDLLGSMMQMQQMKAQQDYQKAMLADREADNAFQQQKFAAEQQAAQQRMAALQRAIPSIAAITGKPEDAVAAAVFGFDDPNNPLLEAFGQNMENREINGRLVRGDGSVIGEYPTYTDTATGPMNTLQGTINRDPVRMQHDLNKSAFGATKISNPVTITQDTLAAKLAETPAAMFRKMSDAAYAAQAGMDATRSIYEMAKQNPDLFGPGMELTADVTRRIEAAKNLIAGGGQPSPDDARLLAVAKAVDVRQTNSAIAKLRDIGGNDTEKEYERVKAAIPGIETSLPSHEVTFIQEKTAADYLTNMQEYVARKTAQATQDRSLGMTTVDDAIREYKQANPLGDQLAANIQAVMQANGLTIDRPRAAAARPEEKADTTASGLRVDPKAAALADELLRGAAATPLLGP